MKKSKIEKYLVILTSCSDGCCTSQYRKETSIDYIKLLNKTNLKKELNNVFKIWEKNYNEEESANESNKIYEDKIKDCLSEGFMRQSSTCGCFQTIIIKKSTELPSYDKISIN